MTFDGVQCWELVNLGGGADLCKDPQAPKLEPILTLSQRSRRNTNGLCILCVFLYKLCTNLWCREVRGYPLAKYRRHLHAGGFVVTSSNTPAFDWSAVFTTKVMGVYFSYQSNSSTRRFLCSAPVLLVLLCTRTIGIYCASVNICSK